ncbi:MAG: DUF4292 domain-containing protein [Bacteroidota bacterium]
MVEVTREAGEQRLAANFKYKEPGNYMVSLRSLTGIEAARLYITDDTILINDRVNKIVYHGSTEYLKQKYGISVKYLPLILGDIIVENINNQYINCKGNESEIIEKSENGDIIYTLNCSTGKVKYVIIENQLSGNDLKVYLDKFKKGDNINYYRNIRITDEKKENTINIKIERISRAIVSDLNFIPGKNYEVIILR